MDYKEYIESNSEVMLGKPVIKGTRITVELILQMLSEGASQSDIAEAYPHLPKEAVLAALAYAFDMVANETVIAA